MARILVVEDEHRLAAGIQAGLHADGFATDVVHDGVDGLWRAREHPYDAIVLDIMLPGMNGYRVCATLRDEDIWTPILMLTAKDGDLDEAEALDTGADDYLTKPCSHVVLVARLRALIRRGRPARPTLLICGDLVLDPAARTVTRGQTPVAVTAREFGLLEHLATHAGDVRSKQQILDHVWDDDFDGDPNIVEVYVARLRAKIDRPFDCATIDTVRGAGYCLRAGSGEE